MLLKATQEGGLSSALTHASGPSFAQACSPVYLVEDANDVANLNNGWTATYSPVDFDSYDVAPGPVKGTMDDHCLTQNDEVVTGTGITKVRCFG